MDLRIQKLVAETRVEERHHAVLIILRMGLPEAMVHTEYSDSTPHRQGQTSGSWMKSIGQASFARVARRRVMP